MIKYILKLFGYKIMSIRMYENERKMERILEKKYQDNIKTLVFNPDSVKAEEIKKMKHMERDFERIVWFGHSQIITPYAVEINKDKISKG